MGKQLYLECYSGISGDMTVAALLDLGADEKVLREALESLPVTGFEIAITRKNKSGLDVCDFDVKLDEIHENHDHDMEYLHGHEHGHNHSHEHGHDHHHEHSHGEAHGHSHEHHHPHEHRGLPEIIDIINKANMTERAKSIAIRIFEILARAESKAHGVPADQVHFHEVGAVDSIVDILSVAICLDNLDITEVIVPYICEGRGTIRCQHGILPVPVPAVANVVEAEGLTLQMTQVDGELVTPTGAAIIAAVRTTEKLPEKFQVLATGIGAGKREYEAPGILRAMIIEPKDVAESDTIYKLETNIDDCTGEVFGYVMNRLLEAGARDVNYHPVYMKKGRPAYQLNVICDKEKMQELEQIIFEETTTIGIRRIAMERTVLAREAAEVDTPYGIVKVKQCTMPNGEVRIYPEYASVEKIAREAGIPLQVVMDAVKYGK